MREIKARYVVEGLLLRRGSVSADPAASGGMTPGERDDQERAARTRPETDEEGQDGLGSEQDVAHAVFLMRGKQASENEMIITMNVRTRIEGSYLENPRSGRTLSDAWRRRTTRRLSPVFREKQVKMIEREGARTPIWVMSQRWSSTKSPPPG
jgi:hypothetical protein